MSASGSVAGEVVEPDTILGNLPVPLTRLLGREDALAELPPLLFGARLLTLCGPGGMGKSRLGVALAEALRGDFSAGAWWADLSASVDSTRVAQAVAAAIVPGEQASNAEAAIARHLNGGSLLVLDNCDQVLAGCAELVTELLARAPTLRIIATSRRSLGIPGEQQYRVPGLTVEGGLRPGSGPWTGDDVGAGSVDRVGGGAVDLFMQRAREAAPGFCADAPETGAAVAHICRWLDGMPLAIELAAARVTVLSVTQIAERLERDSSLLRAAGRAASGQHRTLQATLAWSHEMLGADDLALSPGSPASSTGRSSPASRRWASSDGRAICVTWPRPWSASEPGPCIAVSRT